MSKKIGMPWMKLDSQSHSTNDKHHGNNKAIMCEAMEERWGSDEDIDRSLTSENLYFTEYTSGLELLNDINHEMEELSEYLKKNSKNNRGLRKDAITSFALIVKPDMEIMEKLSEEEKIKFFQDAFDVLNEKFGVNPHNQKPNIRAAVLHKDEGNYHLHLFGVPFTNDGRLSAKEIFSLSFNRWLNEGFPEAMRQKGWDVENCERDKEPDPDSPYDETKYKQLKAEAGRTKKELTAAKKTGVKEDIA